MTFKTRRVVFFVAAPKAGAVRVGSTLTSNLRPKLAEVRAGCPDPISLIGIVGVEDGLLEKLFHRMFRKEHLHDDWFQASAPLLAFVMEYAPSQRETDAVKEEGEKDEPDLGKLLAPKELAALLGVDPRTVKRWVQAKAVPFIRVGGQVRFDPAAVRAKLAEKPG